MATDLATAWGRRIRRIRREKELTVTEVAEQVGITREYLHHIEAGRYQLADDKRLKLAAALGVNPDDIFSYDMEVLS